VPRTDKRVAVPARNHVDVEVEDVLPSGSPVRLEERDAVWGRDLVQATSNRKRQVPDGSRRVLVQGEDVISASPWSDKGVAVGPPG
jgi:hypothetical protein